MSKALGSTKPTGGPTLVLDLMAPSTTLVGVGVEHIGALGEGAVDLYGRYIPRMMAKRNRGPIRQLVCEDDPRMLRLFLEQTSRQAVYQQVSVLIQKANARLITERVDALARLQPLSLNPRALSRDGPGRS